MLAELAPAGFAPAGVDEVKAYLRLEASDEDAVIAGLLRAATAMAEAFTGQWLIARDFEEKFAGVATWQRLGTAPVVVITGVRNAAGGPLAGGAYEVDIDRHGTGWVRFLASDATAKLTVSARAGLAADWNGVPESVRAGIVRLTAQLFTHRDDPEALGLPGAVTALWRPWRVVAV